MVMEMDEKHSIKNIVNNILKIMYGVRWEQDISGWSLSKLCKPNHWGVHLNLI